MGLYRIFLPNINRLIKLLGKDKLSCLNHHDGFWVVRRPVISLTAQEQYSSRGYRSASPGFNWRRSDLSTVTKRFPGALICGGLRSQTARLTVVCSFIFRVSTDQAKRQLSDGYPLSKKRNWGAFLVVHICVPVTVAAWLDVSLKYVFGTAKMYYINLLDHAI